MNQPKKNQQSSGRRNPPNQKKKKKKNTPSSAFTKIQCGADVKPAKESILKTLSQRTTVTSSKDYTSPSLECMLTGRTDSSGQTYYDRYQNAAVEVVTTQGERDNNLRKLNLARDKISPLSEGKVEGNHDETTKQIQLQIDNLKEKHRSHIDAYRENRKYLTIRKRDLLKLKDKLDEMEKLIERQDDVVEKAQKRIEEKRYGPQGGVSSNAQTIALGKRLAEAEIEKAMTRKQDYEEEKFIIEQRISTHQNQNTQTSKDTSTLKKEYDKWQEAHAKLVEKYNATEAAHHQKEALKISIKISTDTLAAQNQKLKRARGIYTFYKEAHIAGIKLLKSHCTTKTWEYLRNESGKTPKAWEILPVYSIWTKITAWAQTISLESYSEIKNKIFDLKMKDSDSIVEYLGRFRELRSNLRNAFGDTLMPVTTCRRRRSKLRETMQCNGRGQVSKDTRPRAWSRSNGGSCG